MAAKKREPSRSGAVAAAPTQRTRSVPPGSAGADLTKSAHTTPVMQQHAAAKAGHPDSILFFRLGDFYEMFAQDAVVAARDLGLTLTSRNKGKPDEIPMAGVPHHAAHGYIARLLSLGHKVAICEQMADPATVKGIVPREVVRVITAGTWTSEEQLEDRKNAWLAAVHLGQDVGFSLLDLSTAELTTASLSDVSQLLSEICRAEPREVLLSSSGEDADETRLRGVEVTLREVLPGAQVRRAVLPTPEQVQRALSVIDHAELTVAERLATASVLGYAKDCRKSESLPVLRAGQLSRSGALSIDRASVHHLELVSSAADNPSACLLSVLDRTKTPGGARLLRRRLLAPLTDVFAIRRRLDQVEVLVQNGSTRAPLAASLAHVGDLERIAVRLVQGEASPRDLGRLREGLSASSQLLDLIAGLPDEVSRGALLGPLTSGVPPELAALGVLLGRALVERPPAQVKDGPVLADGYDEELDVLSGLRLSGSRRMGEYEDELRRQTGISSLRVRFTRVFGWYVEVGRSQASRVPGSFRRKQTVATGERYAVAELDELAFEVQSAEERFREREDLLVADLYRQAAAASAQIHGLAAQLAAIDCAHALADVAVDFDYCRPSVDDSQVLELCDARHPVVERRAALGQFVANDLKLAVGQDHLWMISGPNMAGKSTFLRQVALVVIMAQMGSFVPAKSARVGLCDRVLSRIGASDNLAGGESTFMVEMRETANILQTATRRSLVIVDEIGRGTSTYDGLSIAWAIAEYLDQTIRARSLFATHYHELGELAQTSSTVTNHCVSAREHQGEVVFLHRVVAGVASRSYGVEVARLAGLPETVLARARGLLATFEGDAERPKRGSDAGNGQLDLFRSSVLPSNTAEVLATLKAIDPDRTTGLEALSVLCQLRKLLD